MTSYKPVFVAWVALLSQLPLQIFFAIWGGGFFWCFSQIFLVSTNQSHRGDIVGWPFFFFGALFFCGIPLFAYVARKYGYEHSEYRVYDDHIEIEEGFISINKKMVRFKDVKGVNLRIGPLQCRYGLGSITLATIAPMVTRNNFYPGMTLRDIPDPEDAYEKIKRLVEAQHGED